MQTIVVQPKTQKQLNVINAFLKTLEVGFNYADLTEREKSITLYGKDFVEKIERAEEDIKAGRTITYTMVELEKLCS